MQEGVGGQRLIVLDSDQVNRTMGVSDDLGRRGGRVFHRYGSRVLIADVPASVSRGLTGTPGVVSHHTGPLAGRPQGLSTTETLGISAWNLRSSREYGSAKTRRPHDGLRWDAAGIVGGIQPPDGPGMEHVTEAGPTGPRGIFGDDTSLFLIGSVGVGLVIVEGPTPELQFTEDERTKVVAECQEGLGWLASREPRAGVSFAWDIQVVRVNAAPDPSLSGYEPLEARWRDPAMAALGYMPNFFGVMSYAGALRRKLGTRWAYVGLFTKYPLAHFAYALRPRLVMQYDNDGWGPDNIDRVFTHETGHIFGCPDEYASSNCTCDPKFGYLREPNGNCQRCVPQFEDCLMGANSWAMCAHTPVQLGWRDTDADGVLDPDDPVGNPPQFLDLGRLCASFPILCQLFGLAPPPPTTGAAAARGIAVAAARRHDSVPFTVLRRLLPDADIARIEQAMAAEETEYLAVLERKLRAAADELKRPSAPERRQ